jgi:hypothetical protein
MRGNAFGPKERPEAVALNARQIADAQLIALAPTLATLVLEAREALKALHLQALQSADLRATEWGQEALSSSRATLAKLESL